MRKQLQKISIEETNRQVDNALKGFEEFKEEMKLANIKRNETIDKLLFELNNLKLCSQNTDSTQSI